MVILKNGWLHLKPPSRKKMIDVSLHHARLAERRVGSAQHVLGHVLSVLTARFDFAHAAIKILQIVVHFFEEEEILVAGDLLYTEVHPVTFFGNIPNWLTALKPLFESHYQQLLPGHGPAVEGEQAGRAYFKRMYDYLEDFHGRMVEVKAGRQNAQDVAQHMLGGAYASFGKTRMVQRNINHFLTGRWF